MKYGDCTVLELREYARDGAVVLIPFGCTEQQGPHLPVDFDTWFAEDVCLAAAERLEHRGIKALVLPPLPFGPTPEHRNFGAGYVDLPRDLHDALARVTLSSLAEQGFDRIVLWRGCGGHDLRSVVADFNEQNAARAALPEAPLHRFWLEVGDPEVPGGHADSFTTSISLYRRPETVRHDLVPPEPSAPPDWDDPDLDFGRYSTTGVIGDASAATARRGELLWERCVNWAADYIEEVVSQRTM
ncbi:MAG TPA: creatininase family protein [Mycobacteriales bacterium]|nr:creatininase family protein [Mycobacteriales bacterium]